MNKNTDTPQGYNLDQAISSMNKASDQVNKGKQLSDNLKIIQETDKIFNSNKGISSLVPLTDQEKERSVIDHEKLEKDRASKGRLMTIGLQAKVVRLAKRYFFMRSIAGKAGVSVDTIERELAGRSDEERIANKRFARAFTHAQNRFIAFHQDRLQEYARDKKTKDWHAEKYILTLTDKEYSERKYLTEAVSNQEAKILMLIKAEQLTIAQKQGQDMLKGVKKVANTPLESETISLLPFEQEDKKNKGKAKVKKRVEEAKKV